MPWNPSSVVNEDVEVKTRVDDATRTTKEYGVATIPVSVFYKAGTDNKVIRFCFSKKKETLDAAVERLIKL